MTPPQTPQPTFHANGEGEVMPIYCRTTGQRIGTCRCLRCTTPSPQERAACPE